MPFLPESFKKHASESPDFVGEEGLLHLIKQNERFFWLKYWHRQHELLMPCDLKKETCDVAPYLAFEKYYANKCIRGLFPSTTIDIVFAADDRWEKTRGDDKQRSWRSSVGHPLTVSRDVSNDSDAARERDLIINQVYETAMKYHKDTVSGIYATDEQRKTFYQAWSEADNKMQALCGRDLQIERINLDHFLESYESILQNAIKRNKNGMIAEYLRAGIYPVHPEMNYMPKQKTDAINKDNSGVFLELDLYRPDLYQQYLNSKITDQRTRQQLMDRLKRFLLYATLNSFYYDVYNGAVQKRYWNESDEVYKGLTSCLEAIRISAEKNFDWFVHNNEALHEMLYDGYMACCGNEPKLIKRMNDIKLLIKNPRRL